MYCSIIYLGMRKTTEGQCEESSRSKYRMIISRLEGSCIFGAQCWLELCVKKDLHRACALARARTRYRPVNQIYQLSWRTLNKYCATGFLFVSFLVVFRTSSTRYTEMYVSLQITLFVFLRDLAQPCMGVAFRVITFFLYHWLCRPRSASCSHRVLVYNSYHKRGIICICVMNRLVLIIKAHWVLCDVRSEYAETVKRWQHASDWSMQWQLTLPLLLQGNCKRSRRMRELCRALLLSWKWTNISFTNACAPFNR